MKTLAIPFVKVKPSAAWLLLFFPALFYYTGTRLRSMGLFRSSTYGRSVTPQLTLTPTFAQSCKSNGNDKVRVLFLHKDCQALAYPIYIVQDGLESVVATTWREDEELGRGYLLLSTAAGRGKIFRWETGGGPIAIGRTLNLEDSGCRSNFYRNCTSTSAGSGNSLGSGGIVVDTSRDPPRLIVAEFGEGRISRLEENGARTPLVIEVPATPESSRQSSGDGHEDRATNNYERLTHPTKLLMTPYGDLMILDSRASNDDATGGDGRDDILWRLPKATDIPGLPSLAVSREAHSWKRVNGTEPPHVFFHSEAIGGMVLDPSGQRIYITTRQDTSVLVVSLPLLDYFDHDDEQEAMIDDTGQSQRVGGEDAESAQSLSENDGKEELHRDLKQQSLLVLDYSDFADEPAAIEIDNNGNMYLVVDGGILVVAKSHSDMAKISFSTDPKERIVDLTLGSDKFLYIATDTKLARVRMPNKPLAVQKDLLIKA